MKTCPGAQNVKMGPNALVTAENKSGRANLENGTRRPRYRRKRVWARKTLKRDATPSAPPKMSSAVQNVKTGPNALVTAENKSGRANLENGTRRPQYRRNESGRAKLENGTRRH
jgi:hypothetical protein